MSSVQKENCRWLGQTKNSVISRVSAQFELPEWLFHRFVLYRTSTISRAFGLSKSMRISGLYPLSG
jgi:hypothetical protein